VRKELGSIKDAGKALVLTGYGLFAGARMLARITVGAVRLVIRLGIWTVVMAGALAFAAHLGLQQAAPLVPDPTATAHVLLAVVGVLVAVGIVVVLARGLRGKLAEPQAAPVENIARTDYPTPLTTAGGASSVSPASKTPAGESPKG
jgi:hypothetical protein